jgi:pimeloyl-ACP methyl ester carboxylesterase
MLRKRCRVLLGIAALGCTALASCSGGRPALDAVAEAQTRTGVELERRRVRTNGIELHVVLAGPRDGVPVLLLHGLPEFWWGWHRQIRPLVEAGFRVIVPDQRGANQSAKPAAVAEYRDRTLVTDMTGLLDALGYERVHLAGHDAGAGVAWYLAIEYPERVRRLAVFGIGHPAAFRELAQAQDGPGGPGLAYDALEGLLLGRAGEFAAGLGNWTPLVWLLRSLGEGGAFPEDELDLYRDAWERDGGFHALMNWYRAEFAFAGQREYTRELRVQPPTLVVVLPRDPVVPQEPARRSARFCADGRVVEVPGAAHWILQERPEQASQLLVEFFAAAAP